MRVLVTEMPQGVREGWSDNTYYLCETKQEYNEKLAEYRAKRKEIEEATDQYADFRRRHWTLREDVDITHSSRMVYYDGFPEKEGVSFHYHGFHWHEQYERSDKNLYFVHPDSYFVKP